MSPERPPPADSDPGEVSESDSELDAVDRSAHRDHVVVVGGGVLGTQVVKELLRLGAEVVVVEIEPARADALSHAFDPAVDVIIGDATEDEVLERAHIGLAAGMITTLSKPRDNLFLSVTGRHLNPELRVVSSVSTEADRSKFLTVGAEAVVSPSDMGGMRLAQAMLRPHLVEFADAVIASRDRVTLLMCYRVDPASAVSGKRLGEAELEQRTGCVVLGVRPARRGPYKYHPPPHTRLKAGGEVIALGAPGEVQALGELLSPSEVTARPAPAEADDADDPVKGSRFNRRR